jgi:hypothetical protein
MRFARRERAFVAQATPMAQVQQELHDGEAPVRDEARTTTLKLVA